MTDTRQRLLSATRACIRRRGLVGTTSREICHAAEANLAAITYHFGSKERLVSDALLEGLRQWLAPALQVLAIEGEPAERTMRAVQALVSTFDEHRDDAAAYLEALVHATRMERLRAGFLELWSELRQLLADQMREMQRQAGLPSWVEPEPMAALFIAVANGIVLQVTIDPEGPDLRPMAGQFGALLLSARR